MLNFFCFLSNLFFSYIKYIFVALLFYSLSKLRLSKRHFFPLAIILTTICHYLVGTGNGLVLSWLIELNRFMWVWLTDQINASYPPYDGRCTGLTRQTMLTVCQMLHTYLWLRVVFLGSYNARLQLLTFQVANLFLKVNVFNPFIVAFTRHHLLLPSIIPRMEAKFISTCLGSLTRNRLLISFLTLTIVLRLTITIECDDLLHNLWRNFANNYLGRLFSDYHLWWLLSNLLRYWSLPSHLWILVSLLSTWFQKRVPRLKLNHIIYPWIVFWKLWTLTFLWINWSQIS